MTDPSGLVVAAAIAVFVGAYVLIATEWVHRVRAALGGAALMFLIGATTGGDAFFSNETGVDWNVILLLFGMMVVVSVVKQTGLFEYLAIWAAKRAAGSPYRLLVLLCVITAVASALLDNVTTVLLIAPVTLLVCARVGCAPRAVSHRAWPWSATSAAWPRSSVTHRTSSSGAGPGCRSTTSWSTWPRWPCSS